MRKYISDLDREQETVKEKLKTLGQMSIFAKQRLEQIESAVNYDYALAKQFEKASNVIRTIDRTKEVDER